MKASYRIYFDDKPYLIVNKTDDRFDDLKNKPGTIVITTATNEAVAKSIRELDAGNADSVIVYADNTNETLDLFTSHFKMIQAGGGLVVNEKEEYLFIFRRGKWDLPKGKLDEGETIAECALREVEEETGLRDITLQDHLCNTYHVYHEKGKFILKESVWYNMSCISGQTLTPQTEEDILEIKWLTPTEWPNVYDNTFPSIKDVLKASGKI
jgi:8-oxo-dGTP pyrophosphatase MutT (NUDIX family)